MLAAPAPPLVPVPALPLPFAALFALPLPLPFELEPDAESPDAAAAPLLLAAEAFPAVLVVVPAVAVFIGEPGDAPVAPSVAICPWFIVPVSPGSGCWTGRSSLQLMAARTRHAELSGTIRDLSK